MIVGAGSERQPRTSSQALRYYGGAAVKRMLGFSDFGLQVTSWFVLRFCGSNYVVFCLYNDVFPLHFLLIGVVSTWDSCRVH